MQKYNNSTEDLLLGYITFAIDLSTFMTAMIFLYIFAYLGETRNLMATMSNVSITDLGDHDIFEESLD